MNINKHGPCYLDAFDDEHLPRKTLIVEVGEAAQQSHVNPEPLAVEEGSNEVDSEIIGTVLAILSAILSFGSPTRSAEEEKTLRSLLTWLQDLASLENDPEIAQSASDVALALLTRSASSSRDELSAGSRRGKTEPSQAECSTFEKVVRDMEDMLASESPAMRGLGVRNIIIALREPVEPLSDGDRSIGLRVLISLLADPESFVYLNVIHAISRLAFTDDGKVFTTLLEMFAPTSAITIRQRIILSEAITLILRRSGDAAPIYAPGCISTCIRCIKGTAIDQRNLTITDLEIEEMNLFRQSAISLLAESFAVSNWSAMKYVDDILDISLGILHLENPAISSEKYSYYLESQSELKYGAQSSRRAAAFLIRYIITGLHRKLFRTSDGRSLKMIISALELVEAYPTRTVSVDGKLIEVVEDKVIMFHIRCALALLTELESQELLALNS